ncbi:hypothetical protein HID58_010693 [Brassica napus]|uniref:Uncharacterized protein n=1 Tax=Brassica napus TaxID=3708 RepID=A0ABQ8DYQ8_BRANA|nr:hypothetical protein HID58_010693 [Brassica napus]
MPLVSSVSSSLQAAMINFEFQNSFILFLLSFFSLLSFLGFFFFFKKPKVDLKSPPSPPSLPIIGHLHHFLSPLIHKCFQKISSKYGPYLHLRIFHLPHCSRLICLNGQRDL